MTGLGLALVGGRLVWYRFEDKDCREPVGPRCSVVLWAGAAGLASGLLLMTVFADVPAATPSVGFEPRPGGWNHHGGRLLLNGPPVPARRLSCCTRALYQ